MSNGDMRQGRCAACGSDTVYCGEYMAQNGKLRPTNGWFGRLTVFDTFVCAACGHTQFQLRLDSEMSEYIQRKLHRVPPRQDRG